MEYDKRQEAEAKYYLQGQNAKHLNFTAIIQLQIHTMIYKILCPK